MQQVYSGMSLILAAHFLKAYSTISRFGWTAWNSSIHWLAPVFSGIFVGFGLMAIFVQGFNYLLDVYSNLCVPGALS